jgi:hypothetical protein
MRRLPAAATLALLASPASAAGGPRSFTTDADTVRAGQQIKVWGKGCRSQGYVRIYLNGKEITTTAPTAPACSSITRRSRSRPAPASTA